MKQGIRNLKADNTDHDDDDDYFSDEIELMMNCLSELNFKNMKNIFYYDYINFVLSLKGKKSSCFIQKTTGYILKEENK